MGSPKTAPARARGRIPWDLLPIALLGVGLVIVLGERAVVGWQRYAVEAAWLPPLTALLLGNVICACVALWFGRRRHARVVAQTEREKWLASIRTLGGLRALPPTAFELAVAELLRDRGYQRVTHTGGSGDLCADLTCLTPRGELVVVQCKRYGEKKLVGSPEIQQFLGMMMIHHRAHRGLYVTTSGYTRHAHALAQRHAPALELIDGVRLVNLIQSMR